MSKRNYHYFIGIKKIIPFSDLLAWGGQTKSSMEGVNHLV